MRIAAIIILVGIFGIFAFEVYTFWGRRGVLANQNAILQDRFIQEQKDTQRLQADWYYYLNPENLEKEIKARFNYRRPNEKIMIIVPGNE